MVGLKKNLKGCFTLLKKNLPEKKRGKIFLRYFLHVLQVCADLKRKEMFALAGVTRSPMTREREIQSPIKYQGYLSKEKIPRLRRKSRTNDPVNSRIRG